MTDDEQHVARARAVIDANRYMTLGTADADGQPSMPVKAADYAHLRLTVTDIDRSRAFYDSVFGFDIAFEAPPADADFAVASRTDLDAAAGVLDDRGVLHGGVKDNGAGFIVEFRDPDNVALALFAPA